MQSLTNNFAAFANACRSIAEDVVDENGFVAVRALLRRFNTQLLLRPLLVEAMLCELPDRGQESISDQDRWVVLVDSERYPIDAQDIDAESIHRPLSARFRNTVAHELAHSLAFRHEEFGAKLLIKNAHKSGKDSVQEIEQSVEKASPILLLPSGAMAQAFLPSAGQLTSEYLSEVRKSKGVSRDILINRLSLFKGMDQRLVELRPCLNNVAIGIGEWNNEGCAVFHKWPLYVNFDRNIMPSIVLSLMVKKFVLAQEIFSDNNFVACGGNDHSTSALLDAGTPRNPKTEKMRITCTIERTSHRPKNRFFFVLVAENS